MKEPKRRRLIAVRETFVEIETHETRQSFLAASIAFLATDTASFITVRRYSSMVAQASGISRERLMHSRKMKVDGL
jgi:hypothetical protein